MTSRYGSANAEPHGGIPDHLLAVLLSCSKSGCRRDTATRTRRGASVCRLRPPAWEKRRRDDTGGVHLMEMHANLRRVEDGQLKAEE